MTEPLRAGMVIAERFRLERPLGEGGFATVWTATQLNVDRIVAIKFLKTELQEEFAARFDREAAALARLDHPNCVTLFDFGRLPDGRSYLVTEYLDGAVLIDWLRARQPLELVMNVAVQITAALAAAHRQSIVHRDLKPENVIVVPTPEGPVVKVLDFGIAKLTGTQPSGITKTGDVFGTPGYMSPEQLKTPTAVGPTSDVYSLGVVLFELIEGRPPFVGSSAMAVALQHLQDPAPPIEREVGTALRELIGSMLAKDPADRPADANVVLEALMQGPTQVPARLPTTRPVSVEAVTTEVYEPAPSPTTREYEPDPAPTDEYHPTETTEIHERRGGASNPEDPPRSLAGALVAVALLLLGYGLYSLVWGDDDVGGTGVVVAPVPPPPPAPAAVATPDLAVFAASDLGGPLDVAYPRGCDQPEPGRGVIELIEFGLAAYIPPSYDPHVPNPVLVIFHDFFQRPLLILADPDIQEEANRVGYVVLAPVDVDIRATWRTDEAIDTTRRRLDWAADQLCLDPTREFMLGLGTGGHAAQAIACADPAIAAVATSGFRRYSSDRFCELVGPPRMMISATTDPFAPTEGGAACTGTSVWSLRKHEQALLSLHGCGKARQRRRKEAGSCAAWSCDVDLVTCRVDGNRFWPSLPPALSMPFGTCVSTSADFPYAEEVFGFFADHDPGHPAASD